MNNESRFSFLLKNYEKTKKIELKKKEEEKEDEEKIPKKRIQLSIKKTKIDINKIIKNYSDYYIQLLSHKNIFKIFQKLKTNLNYLFFSIDYPIRKIQLIDKLRDLVKLEKNRDILREILKLVIDKQNIEFVKLLISLKINFYERFEIDKPILHYCVFYKKNKILKIFLNENIDVNFKNYLNQTALHMSVFSKNYEAFKILNLKKDIDLNIKDKMNNSILSYGIKNGDKKIIEMILEKNVKINSEDIKSAFQKNDKNLVKIFLKNIENVNIYNIGNCLFFDNNDDIELFDILIKKHINLNFVDEKKNSFLISAIRNENFQIANLILNQKNLNIDHQDNLGNTALMYSVRSKNPELVKNILKKNPNFFLKNNFLQNAIIILKYYNENEEIKKLILKHVKNGILYKEINFSYFHFFHLYNEVSTIEYLLINGLNINQKCDFRWNPFQYKLWVKKKSFIEYWLIFEKFS